ncbi:peptidase M23 [Putridiphycobacter roseus]|uniref:Peptidase M23 n=1 Tax=Putridiphycobacter roseus TaxID=2219161 RepID=A0A2W1NJ88_9FLAO|nr:M23 family metallopeptidase [Putridiphycobacter roseus]PZE18026.1 peptidase M23 [Putridiphycobacter roseus]
MRLIILLFLGFLPLSAFTQVFFDAKDTIYLSEDRIIKYDTEHQYDVMLNPHLQDMIAADSSFAFKSYWNNHVTITNNQNSNQLLKDTLWLCVLDTMHHNFQIPVHGVITSHFGIRHGRNHNGTDLDLVTGDTVYAAFDGIIRYANYHKQGFGNLIIARHYNGLETYYAHLSKRFVAPNAIIKAGDPIGLGGNTGRSTGSHLHFEVRFYDQPIDPEIIFDFEKKIIKDPNLLVHHGVFEHSKVSIAGESTGGVPGNQKYHRIRSGDTLSAIARRNKTSVARLCKLNKMRVTDTLRIGKTIRVR